MIQLVYRWMQNLAVYMLLVTAFLQALPENSYRKYVRFFCGLLLTVLLAQPVLDLMGEAGQVTELYRTAEYEQMIKEMEYAADLLEKGGEMKMFEIRKIKKRQMADHIACRTASGCDRDACFRYKIRPDTG
mgnify:CR=1 FL=1